VTARLLERLPQEARVAGFIEGLAAELAKLPANTRAQLSDAAGTLRLIAPRALQPDELAALRTALAKVLAHVPPIEVVVDATVIAGLELEAAHAIVRNSFRNDLTRLKTELLAHDTVPA
jgi:F-type H+-transporting ATPase subunit b